MNEDILNSPKPQFPIIMIQGTLFKNYFIDPIVFLTTIILLPIGWILGVAVAFTFGGILWLWMFMRLGATQMITNRKTTLRLLATVAVGFVPILRLLLPAETILVLSTYFEQKKEWEKKRGKRNKNIQRSQYA